MLVAFHLGVFIARGKEDALITKNLVPGETVYGEKKISVDVSGYRLKQYAEDEIIANKNALIVERKDISKLSYL